MIEVKNVEKRLGNEQVLCGVSFTAPTGKITGFLGPNGSGKTTTFKTMLNLMKPDNSDASVTYNGEHLSSFSLPLTKVGASIEINAMDKRRKAIDHLRAYAPLAECSNQRVDMLLDEVGLGNAKTKRAGSYSMGMKQRLALAMAMLGDPDFLILDEPANGLDPDGIAWIRDHLRVLADQGKTVIVSSHLLNEAQKFIDYVVIIKDGRVSYEGDIPYLNELCKQRTGKGMADLEEAYRIITAKDEE
jgi:ABC transporter related